jgi:hypothetical protein
VLAMLRRSNELATWAMYCVLQGRWVEGAPVDKSRMFGKFLRIAYYLLKENNFFAAAAIFSSLSTVAVQRIMRGAISGSMMTPTSPSSSSLVQSRRGGMGGGGSGAAPEVSLMLGDLNAMFSPDSNFQAYRRAVHTCKMACVPSLLVLMRDVTVLEEGMPDKLNGLINYHKRSCNAKLINDFMSHREPVYPLQQVDQITALLKGSCPHHISSLFSFLCPVLLLVSSALSFDCVLRFNGELTHFGSKTLSCPMKRQSSSSLFLLSVNDPPSHAHTANLRVHCQHCSMTSFINTPAQQTHIHTHKLSLSS